MLKTESWILHDQKTASVFSLICFYKPYFSAVSEHTGFSKLRYFDYI